MAEPSRDKLKIPNPEKGAASDKPAPAGDDENEKKKRPVPRLPGLVGPMEPKQMGPSPAGLFLIFLLVIGSGVGWILGRMKLHERRDAVAISTGKMPDKLRLLESKNGGLTKKDFETLLASLAADAGASIDGPVTVTAEKILVKAENQGVGDNAAIYCKILQLPPSFKELPVTDRTEFQVLLNDCRMQRWVVTFKASIPLQFFAFKDVYVPTRAVLVRRYAEDGEFEEEEEEEEAPSFHREDEPEAPEEAAEPDEEE